MFSRVHPSRSLVASTFIDPGDLHTAQAGITSCLHPCGFCFTKIENIPEPKGQGGSPRFQRKLWETKQCEPERAVSEALRAKSKVQWGPRRVQLLGTRNICRAIAQEARGRGCEGFEKYCQRAGWPQTDPGAGHETTEFNAYSDGVQNCFVPIPFYLPIFFSCTTRLFTLCSGRSIVFEVVLDFHRSSQLRV